MSTVNELLKSQGAVSVTVVTVTVSLMSPKN